MKKLGLFAVMVVLILAGCKTIEQGLLETGYRQLKGEELKKTFIGKTDYTSAGENWHYSEDGKISGVSKSGRSVDGKWKMNDAGTICINWDDQYLPSGCSRYYINDKTGEIVWLEPDGQNSKSNLQ